MTFRSVITTALARAQAYSGDIIVALARASDEDSDAIRREHLADALADSERVTAAIRDALTAEQPVKEVA